VPKIALQVKPAASAAPAAKSAAAAPAAAGAAAGAAAATAAAAPKAADANATAEGDDLASLGIATDGALGARPRSCCGRLWACPPPPHNQGCAVRVNESSCAHAFNAAGTVRR
jgi:hypothetical protein